MVRSLRRWFITVLLLAPLGCGGGGTGNSSPPPPPIPTITLQQTTAKPFHRVTVGNAAESAGLTGTVRLRAASDPLGLDVTLDLLSTNPVQFLCPPFLARATGAPASGAVTLEVNVEGRAYAVLGTLEIDDLPVSTLSDGEVLRNVLISLGGTHTGSIEQDIRDVIANAPGGSSFQADAVLTDVSRQETCRSLLAEEVDAARADSGHAATLGMLGRPSGDLALTFDTGAMVLMDRLLLALHAAMASEGSPPQAVAPMRAQPGQLAEDDLFDGTRWVADFKAWIRTDPAVPRLGKKMVVVGLAVMALATAPGWIAAGGVLAIGGVALWAVAGVQNAISDTVVDRITSGADATVTIANGLAIEWSSEAAELNDALRDMGTQFTPQTNEPDTLGSAFDAALEGLPDNTPEANPVEPLWDGVSAGQPAPYPYANVSGSYVGYYSVNPKPWTINVSVRPDGSGSYSWTSENVSGSANGSVSNENPGWRIHGNSDYQIQCRPDGSSVTFWYILCPGGVNCFVITAYPN